MLAAVEEEEEEDGAASVTMESALMSAGCCGAEKRYELLTARNSSANEGANRHRARWKSGAAIATRRAARDDQGGAKTEKKGESAPTHKSRGLMALTGATATSMWVPEPNRSVGHARTRENDPKTRSPSRQAARGLASEASRRNGSPRC